MAKKLQQLRPMMSSVPGVVQTIPEASPTSNRISRFIPLIVDTKVPKHFQNPRMKHYDGITDLKNILHNIWKGWKSFLFHYI